MGAALPLVVLNGCDRVSPGAGAAPRAWTRFETSLGHAKERAEVASRGDASSVDRMRDAIIAQTPWPAVPADGRDADWRPATLEAIHRLIVGGEPRSAADALRQQLRTEEVLADPVALATVRTAYAVAVVRESESSPRDVDRERRGLTEAAAVLASVGVIPDGPVNEAACHAALAELEPESRPEHLAAARAALGRLDLDAALEPDQPAALLGVRLPLPAVAIVLDVASHPSESVRASAVDAALGCIRSLPPGSHFVVVAAGAETPVNGHAFISRGSGDFDRLLSELRSRLLASSAVTTPPSASAALAALKAVAELRPASVALVTAAPEQGVMDDVESLARSLAGTECRFDAFVLPVSGPLADLAVSRLAQGWLGGIVGVSGGSIYVLQGAGVDPAAPLTGETVRVRAQRLGDWTPDLARHHAAVVALTSGGMEGARAARAALDALRPDPITPAPGPARSDWRLLMLEGARRAEAGDRSAFTSFEKAAGLLAELASERGIPGAGDGLAELSCRALLLSALIGAATEGPASAQRALDQAVSLGVDRDGWSVRLLRAGAGASGAQRARFSLPAEGSARELCQAELDAVLASFGSAPPAGSDSPEALSALPELEALVFRRTAGRAPLTGNAP